MTSRFYYNSEGSEVVERDVERTAERRVVSK